MNTKEQIEEMKELLCESINGKCNGFCVNCNCMRQAEALYNAGYRKQSEVIDDFVERLIEKSKFINTAWGNLPYCVQVVIVNDIAKIAKEMKGGAE